MVRSTLCLTEFIRFIIQAGENIDPAQCHLALQHFIQEFRGLVGVELQKHSIQDRSCMSLVLLSHRCITWLCCFHTQYSVWSECESSNHISWHWQPLLLIVNFCLSNISQPKVFTVPYLHCFGNTQPRCNIWVWYLRVYVYPSSNWFLCK